MVVYYFSAATQRNHLLSGVRGNVLPSVSHKGLKQTKWKPRRSSESYPLAECCLRERGSYLERNTSSTLESLDSNPRSNILALELWTGPWKPQFDFICEMEIRSPVRSEVPTTNEVLKKCSPSSNKMELLKGKFSFRLVQSHRRFSQCKYSITPVTFRMKLLRNPLAST